MRKKTKTRLEVMMTDTKDPWKGLKLPSQSDSASARRVDPNIAWGLYWALDIDNSPLLLLRHKLGLQSRGRLPTLHGLDIYSHQPQNEDHTHLVVRLKDNEQREIFHRLCLDIIAATSLAKSEDDAVNRFIARTWRWHWLLRGGRDERLSDNKQKGLIGELHVLHEILLPCLGAENSVKAWTGPLGSPKDFEIGAVCIEAKARRGGSAPFASISTEHQLETEGLAFLFLSVLGVSPTSEDDPNGVSVTDIAKNFLDQLQEKDTSIVDLYEARLMASGFDWNHDYSDKKWLLGSQILFEVKDGFPRITPGMYPAGVSNLTYSISLQECDPFKTEISFVTAKLAGETNANQP